LTLRICQ